MRRSTPPRRPAGTASPSTGATAGGLMARWRMRPLRPPDGRRPAMTTLPVALDHLGGAILATITDAVIVCAVDAPDRPIVWVNAAFEAMTGWDAAEVVGRNPRFVIGPVNDATVVAGLMAVRESDDPAQATLVIARRDGGMRWAAARTALVALPDGAERHRIWYLRDVTVERDTDQELRRSEAFHRGLAEQSSDVITILDQSGTITYMGGAIQATLGASGESYQGRKGLRMVHRDDLKVVSRAFDEALTNGHAPAVVVRYRHADGTYRWLESVAIRPLDELALPQLDVNSRD